jgi:hypothetical protein
LLLDSRVCVYQAFSGITHSQYRAFESEYPRSAASLLFCMNTTLGTKYFIAEPPNFQSHSHIK